MSVDLSIDTSQLDEFVVHLKGSGQRLGPTAAKSFKRTAQDTKTKMQADYAQSRIKGLAAIKHFVSYDEPSGTGSNLTTKIGIDKEGAGNLGNVAVFGTPKGGGTHPHPEEFLEAELPKFTKYLLEAVEEAI